jgi:hypothetical protein
MLVNNKVEAISNIDTINITPICDTCSFQACVVANNLSGSINSFSVNICNTPLEYNATNPDANGCVIFTPTSPLDAVGDTACIVACKNGICDTTLVFIAAPPIVPISISGDIFNDVNGLSNNIIDGNLIDKPSGSDLYIHVVDANNIVVARRIVNSNGSFNFNNFTYKGTHFLLLSTIQGLIGDIAPAVVLPTEWGNTAEFIGSGNGNDGLADGKISLLVGNVDITDVKFGIEELPTTSFILGTSILNPGSNNLATIATNTFYGEDFNGGIIDSILIPTFPTNTDEIILNSINYTLSNWPFSGVTIPTNANGEPTSTILLDPINGATISEISYLTRDNAGLLSTSSGIAIIPFHLGVITGYVIDDINGSTDNLISGTGTNAGGVFAILLDANNNVIGSTSVLPTGEFYFYDVEGGNYKVYLSNSDIAIGSNALAVPLQSNTWANTAASTDTTLVPIGPDNAFIEFTLNTDLLSTLVLAVNQRPTADDKTFITLNPQTNVFYATPSNLFTGADASGGSLIFAHLLNYPANIDSMIVDNITYVATNFPSGGILVMTNTQGHPIIPIQVDPIDGDVTVQFKFLSIDNASIKGTDTGSVTIIFLRPVTVTGSLIHDADNSANNTFSNIITNTEQGTNTEAPLFAYLSYPPAIVIADMATLSTDGVYGFSNIGGNSNIQVLISKTIAAIGDPLPSPSVNDGWMATTPLIKIFNVGSPIPAIVPNVDFGSNKIPTSLDTTTAAFINPNGNYYQTIPNYAYVNEDFGTGNINSITLVELPNNVTSILIDGTTYNTGNFPSTGVTITTNASGEPLIPIELQPIAGIVKVALNYVSTDNGGAISDTGIITIPFAPNIVITGTVYDDDNALFDNTINGGGNGNPFGNPLFVNALDGFNNVVSTTNVQANGNYTITNLPGLTTYNLQVTKNPSTITTQAPTTQLPMGWINIGEYIGMGSGNDGFIDGKINVITDSVNIIDANFGINELGPVADINITYIYSTATGNLSINDEAIPVGSTYGNASINPNNPGPALPVINTDGSYSFLSIDPGVFEFQIPIITPDGSILNTALIISVLEAVNTIVPVVNPDFTATQVNKPIIISTLQNDYSGSSTSTFILTSVAAIDSPSNGQIIVNTSTGEFTYSPNTGFVGIDSFSYTVTNNNSISGTALQIITVQPNYALNTTFASDDFGATLLGLSLANNVKLNDTDPNGDPQIVVAQTITDANIGTFNIVPSGEWSFEPAASFSGSTNFTYKIYDSPTAPGSLPDTAVATVFITVLPTSPILLPDANTTWLQSTVVGSAAKNDKFIPAGTYYNTPFQNLNNPDGGASLPIVSPDGTYTFTPTITGVYKWLMPAITPTEGTFLSELRIKVIDKDSTNEPPIANTDYIAVYNLGTEIIATLANDISSAIGAYVDSTSVAIIQQPNKGIASVINTNGNITYSPFNGSYVGLDTLMYSIKDNFGKLDTGLVIIDILPNRINVVVANDDAAFSLLNQPVIGNVLINDYNPTVIGAVATPVILNTTGSYTDLFGNTLLLNVNGDYTFTPAPSFQGPADFTYIIENNKGTKAGASIHFLVSPSAPLNFNNLLLIGKTVANSNQLSWKYFNVKEVENFKIYKLTLNKQLLQTITDIQAETFNYTDFDLDQVTNKYVIEAKLKNGTIITSNTLLLSNTFKDENPKIYPNPTADFITINCNTQEDILKLEIISASGQIVFYKKEIQLINGKCQIDLMDLSSGIYSIILSNTTNTIIQKIQKK